MGEMKTWHVPIVDIGAESTAPMEDPISAEEERSRFDDVFFPFLRENDGWQELIFSIDTYRPCTLTYVEDIIQNIGHNDGRPQPRKVIWNDVSGVVDEDVFTILQERPYCHYIYCHNLTTERERTSFHMDQTLSCTPEETWEVLYKDFEATFELFDKRGLSHRVIFDPAFGFSKTFEQNWDLMKNLPRLIGRLPHQIPWAIGISRKSFLKKMSERNSLSSSRERQSEYLQACLLANWMKELKNHQTIYFRLHDPAVFAMAKVMAQKF